MGVVYVIYNRIVALHFTSYYPYNIQYNIQHQKIGGMIQYVVLQQAKKVMFQASKRAKVLNYRAARRRDIDMSATNL